MLGISNPVHAADASNQAKTQLAMDFMRDIRQATFVEHDPVKVRAVAERYMTADYLQHSAGYGAGREGFIERMSALAAQTKGQPSMPALQIVYAQADGDLVVWVSKTSRPDEKSPGKQVELLQFNMVRVAGDKLAEHWSGE